MTLLNAFRFGVSVLALVTCSSAHSASSEISSSTEQRRFPHRARGQEALTMAEPQLVEISRLNHMDEPSFRRVLKQNHDLWLDHRGQLYYSCEGLALTTNAQAAAAVQAAEALSSAIVPTSTDAFKLHSLPGANRVIYLDFTGHTTSGTAWNTSTTGGADIVSAPFDFDGDPSTFSAAERQRITRIWQRVSEDYMPFAIDITTEDPGLEALRKTSSSDQNYGVRVVISPTSAWNPGAGGIAYVGSFNWNSDTPCFVFSDNLGPNSEKAVAEAASHEAGHTLGLHHEGTTSGTAYYAGQGNWAPIMGVSYYKPVSQWALGEYPLANNKEDQLAVMQTFGAPLLADDHGNTMATATLITGPSVTAVGVIGTRSDVDMFRMDIGAGGISLNIAGTSPESDLDIKAELLDSSGTVLVANDPAGLSSSITTTVSAGTYFLRIDGVGSGDPATTGYSDYGSLGEYIITGTIPSGSGTPSNQLPSARATATPTSGTSPLTVAFSSAGSLDPDGTIVSLSWNFGDGATSTESNPTHLFTAAGNYSVVLTVTDNGGATATSTVSVTVTAPSSTPSIDVNSFTLAANRTSAGSTITSVVRVLNQASQPVAGVNLSLRWNGVFSGTLNRTTDANGQIQFTTSRTTNSGSTTVTIATVTPPSGSTYNPNLFPASLTQTITINQ